MKFSQMALVGAATVAAAQPHNHLHRHPARHGAPVVGRDAATTTTVPGPIVTVFELDGKVIPADEVESGISQGKYVFVGDKISTVLPASTTSTTPVPTSTSTTPVPTTSTTQAAQFIEVKTSSTSSTSSAAPSTTSTTAEAKVSIQAIASASATSSSSGSTGVDAEFPSGKVPCSTFPSAYGAVAVDWLDIGGWTGIQNVPSYSPGASSISDIVTAIAGATCTKNSFCSYACPAGYQKSQWPSAQGNTGQSIGGLYCNSDGYLELSRSAYSQICTAGVGNVQVKNNLSKNVAICRTDYPGTESETVPLDALPGTTQEVTCPDASSYYTWGGAATSAQYYINPSGYSLSEACIWGDSSKDLGNWAPVNMGVGKGLTGETFISLFPNAPTNPDGKLDFDIAITGGVSGTCTYDHQKGTYFSNGVESSTGCTVAVTGTAVFEFS